MRVLGKGGVQVWSEWVAGNRYACPQYNGNGDEGDGEPYRDGVEEIGRERMDGCMEGTERKRKKN